MLVLNDVVHDGRVRREAAALAADGWRVLVIGTHRHDSPLPDREQFEGVELWRVRYGAYGATLRRPWRWLRHAAQAVQIVRAVRSVRTRVHHAHDLPALLLIAAARIGQHGRARLVYDAHELYLFMPPYASRWVNRWHAATRPLFLWLEGIFARRADRVVTSCDSHARALARWHRLPRPIVVRNAIDPPADTAAESTPPQRAARRIIVHTGEITNRGRTLTEAVEALRFLPEDVAVRFLGWGEDEPALVQLAADGGDAQRVAFVPPVPPDRVASTIADACAALVLLRPDCYSVRGALPNKFFEAIAAGLPVVASNTPDVRRMVRRYGLGAVCDPLDPASIAAAVRQVLDPVGQARYRANARRAQRDVNWTGEAARLCACYRALLGA